MRTIRVSVKFTLIVDVDVWAAEYGIEPTAVAVREDVKAYFGDDNAAHIMPEHLIGIVRPA